MRCNAGTADVSKILSNDGACPVCDQVLSKSLMKPVDINPNDEWTNMAMVAVSPQISQVIDKNLVKNLAFDGLNQKMAKRCQMMEKEIENLSKDKEELQEKFAEKSKKRKLDEMYDQLRNEFESLKRSAIQPVNGFYPRAKPNIFSHPINMMDNRDSLRKVDVTIPEWSVFTPATPGPREEDIWPARQFSSNSGHFDISGGSPANQTGLHVDSGNRRGTSHPSFGGGVSNPSITLRNLILSPIKRPQLSHHPQIFT